MAVTQIRGNTQIMDLTIEDAQISASAAIALSKLAEAVIQADGGQAFSGNQSMGGNTLTNVADPLAASDVANKSYVDTVATGLNNFKQAVRACTTANIANLAAAPVLHDGVTLVQGDRVLVAAQTLAQENGIYEVGVVSGTAPFTRATDADTDADVTAGMYLVVTEGTAHADQAMVLSTDNPITLGTTPLAFTLFSSLSGVNGGNGLTKTGSTLDVGAGDGITVDATSVAVDATAIAGSNLENDGSNNLRIAAAAAGNGLIGGAAAALAVGAGNGITVSADAVTVNDDSTGGANLAKAVNVSANGVAVKVDDVSIEGNATTGRLNIKALGVNAATLNADVAGAGLTGGAGAAIDVNPGNGIAVIADAVVADLDGSTLKLGAAGLALADLPDGQVLVGNGSSVATARTLRTREIPTGLINGGNTTFTLINAPVNGTEMVYLNGLLQDEGAGNDYTIIANTITFGTAPLTGSKILVSSIG